MPDKQDSPDIFALERTFPDAAGLFSFQVPPLESPPCDVVLDTSVLLLPYRTDSKSLAEIKRVYEKIKSEKRLFVPERVSREFVRNKARKISDLTKALADKSSKLIEQASITSYPFLEGLEAYTNLGRVETRIKKQIGPYKAAVAKLIDAINGWGWNDPVTKIYRELFTADVIKGHSSQNEAVEKELKYRTINKIPPGYKDAAKEDGGVGDLIIWLTILEIGKTRQKPLVFVTGEEKTDWWHRSDKRGMLPRYELIDEFRTASSGKAFYIVSFSEFLKHFGASEEVVSAVNKEEKTINFGLHIKDTSSAELNFSVQDHPLVELSAREPRAAVQQGWEFLAEGILMAANIGMGNTRPDSPSMGHALARLQNSPSFPLQLVEDLEQLRNIAVRAFNQSVFAYDPSPSEAKAFVTRCLQLRISLSRPTPSA
jgi:predicted nucleic acid-binding protein